MEKNKNYNHRIAVETCCDDNPTCSKDLNIDIERRRAKFSIEKKLCPMPDILTELQFTDDPEEIQHVLNKVKDSRLTKTVEFIFSLRPFVKDGGKLLTEFLEKDLAAFRTLVDDTVDYRVCSLVSLNIKLFLKMLNNKVQDEGDVIHVTQNTINEKFHHLTIYMEDRTVRIMEKLSKISSKFDWRNDGKDRSKLWTLISINKKKQSAATGVDTIKNLIHQIFIRDQWLKCELHRLQEENNHLQNVSRRFKQLAVQRKAEEIKVPRMLAEQQQVLEKRFEKLKETYHKNTKKIHALYVNT